jgi:hypothetical protein
MLGGPALYAAHWGQKLPGPVTARPNRLRRLWQRVTSHYQKLNILAISYTTSQPMKIKFSGVEYAVQIKETVPKMFGIG